VTAELALGQLHGSCVAFGNAGILILGRSGSGKSALALALIALGAKLVADDRVELYAEDTGAAARAPAVLQGLIEARRIGLLQVDHAERAPVRLVIDLDREETDRLPPRRKIKLGTQEVDLILGGNTPNLAIAAKLYVTSGRRH
jgi:HPr kinase/phosphorylase